MFGRLLVCHRILNKYGLDVQKAANATICRQISEIDGLSGAVRMKVPIDTVKAFGAVSHPAGLLCFCRHAHLPQFL